VTSGSTKALRLTDNAYNNIISRNNITTSGGFSPGIAIQTEIYNNTFYDNNITTLDNRRSYGILMQDNVNNNTFFRNSISSLAAGIFINGSGQESTEETRGNTFTNDTIITCNSGCASGYYDIVLTSNVTDIIFLNVSFNKSRISIVPRSPSNPVEINNLTVQWYLDVNVTDSSDGSAVANAWVMINDSNAFVIFNDSADSNGDIPIQIVTEFTMNGTVNSNDFFAASDTCVGFSTHNISCFAPFNISVNHTDFSPAARSVDVNRSMLETISLSGIPGENACGTLSTAGFFYNLTQDVASDGTCFQIQADNITLDCKGFEINYSQTTVGSGIDVNFANFTTIRSCVIVQSIDGSAAPDSTDDSYGINVTNAARNTTIYNNTITTNGSLSFGIYLFTKVVNSSVYNNTITTGGGEGFGIILRDVSYNKIYSNVIITTGKNAYGVRVRSASNFNNIYNNVINTSGNPAAPSNSHGIRLNVASNNNVYRNKINTTGQASHGISLLSGANNNNIYSNSIVTTADAGIGINFITNSYNNITNNSILTKGANSKGMQFSLKNFNHIISGNNITAQKGKGISIVDNAYNNTFFNNNITTQSNNKDYGIYLQGNVSNNTFFRNTIASLTAGIVINGSSDGGGETRGNTFTNDTIITCNSGCAVGYYDIILTSNVTDITFLNVSFNKSRISIAPISPSNPVEKNNLTVQFYLDVNVTDSSDGSAVANAWVMINDSNAFVIFNDSADSNGDIPIQIVTEFTMNGSTNSNDFFAASDTCVGFSTHNISCFAPFNISVNHTDFSPAARSVDVNRSMLETISLVTAEVAGENACGTLDSSGTTYELTQNVGAAGTCMIIGAPHITLDCKGFRINFSESVQAAFLAGVDNSAGHANVTIKNCIIQTFNGSGANDNYGIYFSAGENGTLYNNTITVNGTDHNFGIYLNSNSIDNNVTGNTINTNGSSTDNIGIYMLTDSLRNLIDNNTVATGGTNSNYGIRIRTRGLDNIVIDNTVSTDGTSGNDNYGIHLLSEINGTLVANNTITTDGAGGSNYGIFVNTRGYRNVITKNTVSTNGSSDSNYGVYIVTDSSDNNVTFNTINTNGSSNSNFGIFVSTDSNSNLIDNNTIATGGTFNSRGIRIFRRSVNNTVTDNTIFTDGTSGNSNYGIQLKTDINGTLVANNTITTDGAGNANYGIYVDERGYRNIITENSISTNGTSDNYGVLIQTTSEGNNVTFNTITTNGSSDSNYGITIQDSDSNFILNNTITTDGTGFGFGVYFLGDSDNNIVTNNTISTFGGTNSEAFRFQISGGEFPENNNLTGNILLSITGNDIEFGANYINGTWLIDQRIRTYDFDTIGVRINVKNTTSGQIEFTGLVSGTSGLNLFGNSTSDIRIDNNSVFVNASVQSQGLNASANVTLYNIGDQGLTNLRIERDGVECDLTTLPGCFNFTLLDATDVKFNVSAWSKYNISGDTTVVVGENACGTLSTAGFFYNLTQDVSSDGTCFIIAADNITLDCRGFEINYSQTTVGSGIDVNFANFTTIRSCVIVQSVDGSAAPDSTDDSYGINVTNAARNTTIYNNTITTNGSISYGISLNFNSINSSIYNNTITTSGGEGNAIRLRQTTYNNIFSNIIITSGFEGYGMRIRTSSHFNDIYSNVINTSGILTHAFSIASSDNNDIYNNKINVTGVSSIGFELLSGSENNNIYSNSIIATGGAGHGIWLITNSYNNVTNNSILITNVNGAGIRLSNTVFNNKISGNNITTTNSNTPGIYLRTNIYNNTFYDNNITTQHANKAYGIHLKDNVNNNTFFRNTISSLTVGILINGSGQESTEETRGNTFTNDTIISCTTGCADNYYDIILTSNVTDITFLNVSFNKSRISIVPRDLANPVEINNLTVQWYLDVNVTNSSDNNPIVGAQVIINDSTSFNIFDGNTDSTGGIPQQIVTEFTMNGSTNSNDFFAAKDTCVGFSTHNITCFSPYNISVNFTSYANVSLSFDINRSSFLNISMSITVVPIPGVNACGTLDSSGTTYELTQNVGAAGSCMIIGAPHITLDCKGFRINFSESVQAAFLAGVDNSAGHANVTIKNCIIQTFNGSGADDNYGIYFNAAENGTIYNNTISINGTDNNYGIFLVSSSIDNNVTANTINTNGSSSNNFGVYVLTNSHRNFIYNNTVATGGTNSNDGMRIVIRSLNNTVRGNTISTDGISGNNNFGILLGTDINGTLIVNNTISTDGAGSSNIGIRVDIRNYRNVIKWNSISTDGTSGNIGVQLSKNSSDNNVTFNTINTNGSSNSNYGIYMNLDSSGNLIDNNTIATGGTSDNNGIRIRIRSLDNTVRDNTISTDGTSGNDNYGVILTEDINGTLVVNNTIKTDGAGTSNYGVLVDTRSYRNVLTENKITTNGTSGNPGIRIQTDSSNNNVTFNTINTNGSSSDNAGIVVTIDSNRNLIDNNTIATGGTSSNFGIDILSRSLDNTISDNTISTDGTAGSNTGIRLVTDINGTLIVNNTITTDGAGSDNYGIFVNVRGYRNVITKNTISTNGTSNNFGVYFNFNSSNNNVTFNTITTNGSSSNNYGVRILDSNSMYILNNTITTDGTGTDYGIYFQQESDNNIVTNNTISTSGSTTSDAFFFAIAAPEYPENNNLTGNILLSIAGNDIEFGANYINGTWLIDQTIRAYDFDTIGNRINVKNSTYGQIEFIGLVSGTTGLNLIGNSTSDIRFDNNSVFVNASVQSQGLNASANVTLYNIGDRGLTNLRIERDGVECDLTTLPGCFAFTALDATDVKFNVSAWSKYNISGDAPVVVVDNTPPVINGSLNDTLTSIFQNDVINATFNATDNVNLTNGTIVINSSGADNIRYFNFTFIDDGVNPTNTQQISQNFTISEAAGTVINITGIARDNSSNFAQNSTIFTIASAAAETDGPNITLVAPANKTTFTNIRTNVNFTFNVKDASSVGNCSLIINNSINKTIHSVTKDININISTNFSNVRQDYSWYVNCTDTEGNTNTSNQTRQITIDFLNETKGVIPTTVGAVPFYTINSNPNSSCRALVKGDNCNIKWRVNATGNIGDRYVFFAFANATNYTSDVYHNETIRINITIVGVVDLGDVTPPIINGSLNESTIVTGTVLNATFNATDNVNLTNGTIVINSSGADNIRYFNFTFGDNGVNPTNSQQISQNFTISEPAGTVINITGIARDNSSNIAQNETIFTVAAGQVAPIVIINNITFSVDPVSGGDAIILISINVTDADGIGNINATKTIVNLTLGSRDIAQFRFNISDDGSGEFGTCKNGTHVTESIVQINCTIAMRYYDNASANWVINVSVEDLDGNVGRDDTVKFTYNQLSAFTITARTTPEAANLNFSSVNPNVQNQEAKTPILLNNTGNDDFDQINITGADLLEDGGSGSIAIANFFVNTTNNSNGQGMELSLSPQTIPALTGNAVLFHGPGISGDNVPYPGTADFLSRGNLSLYFFVDIPAGIKSATYNNTWNLTVVDAVS